ncbi:hypothetical protein, partial [Sulfitobacter sp.]|uniref:hypothetical protein n=1 Tax=Sulfitobacter sp. TaxID=1903071 RepID=UPI004058E18A
FISSVDNIERMAEATEIARKIPSQALREGAISSISAEYAKAGKFSEALSSLKLIREPYKLTESLLDVAAEMN